MGPDIGPCLRTHGTITRPHHLNYAPGLRRPGPVLDYIPWSMGVGHFPDALGRYSGLAQIRPDGSHSHWEELPFRLAQKGVRVFRTITA